MQKISRKSYIARQTEPGGFWLIILTDEFPRKHDLQLEH